MTMEEGDRGLEGKGGQKTNLHADGRMRMSG